MTAITIGQFRTPDISPSIWAWSDLAFGVCNGYDVATSHENLEDWVETYKKKGDFFTLVPTIFYSTWDIASACYNILQLAPSISFIADHKTAIKWTACIWIGTNLFSIYYLPRRSWIPKNQVKNSLIEVTPKLLLATNVVLTALELRSSNRAQACFTFATIAITLADKTKFLPPELSWVWDKFYYAVAPIAFWQGSLSRKCFVTIGLMKKAVTTFFLQTK